MTVARSWRHATPRRDHGASSPSDNNTLLVVIPSPPYLFGNSSALLLGVSSPSNDRSTRDPPPPADEAWVLGVTLSTPFPWRLWWHLLTEAPCILHGKRLRWHLPPEAPYMEATSRAPCLKKRPTWKATSVAFAPRSALLRGKRLRWHLHPEAAINANRGLWRFNRQIEKPKKTSKINHRPCPQKTAVTSKAARRRPPHDHRPQPVEVAFFGFFPRAFFFFFSMISPKNSPGGASAAKRRKPQAGSCDEKGGSRM